jgi:diguanylate cyclase (GGDEF)-like protein
MDPSPLSSTGDPSRVPSLRPQQAAPGRTSPIVVLAGLFGALAVGLTVGWIRQLHLLPAPTHVPWWVLAAGFAAADILPIHLDTHRQTHSFSLIELPLVIGLLFASPLGVVAAWVVGSGIGLALFRRQAPVKLVFNVASFALEATTAVVLFRLLLGSATGVGPSVWGPVFAAALLANLIGVACVTAVIAITGGEFRWRPALRLVATTVIAAPVANTSLALCAAALLWGQPASLWMLVAVVAVMVLGYRGYAALSARYANLQLLYQFTQAVERPTEGSAALQSLLASTRLLLRADAAELLLVDDEGGGAEIHSMFGDEDAVVTGIFHSVGAGAAYCQRTVSSGESVRVPANTRNRALKADLVAAGRHDYMVVPLRRDGRVIGALAVANRVGDVATFHDTDLRLFEAFANHAAVSIEIVSLFDRLRHAALHDELTGLPNRSAFNQDLDEAIQQQISGTKLAVLLMDLDRFKEINDTLGHHQGDQVLTSVAARLRGLVRPGDTLARLGGDEFAVLLTRVDDVEQALAAADRIRSVVSEPHSLGGLSVTVGATIGIAMCPDDGVDASTLLQRADVAMYTAKGGHGIAVYSIERDNYSPSRLALVGELQAAIDTGELELYWQPQADLRTGVVVGAEALLRWTHQQLGFVPPEEFVGLAERTGLIRPLTLFVLRSATTQWRAWHDAGFDWAISVNLSARNLLDRNLVDDVADALGDAAMPPSLLTLEITETSVMADIDRSLAVLQRLALLGVRLSVDDFGTGYSSLAYLKRLPVNEVKIDKSFVINMECDEDDLVIVRAVIDLASNLGLNVVAEGVETQTAWNMLAESGCTVGQGYFLSRPVPAAQFLKWVIDRHEATHNESRSRSLGVPRISL